MCRLLTAFFVILALFALNPAATATAPATAASTTAAASPCGAILAAAPPIQLAQSGCRSECSSRRSYCLSSCSGRSQCSAICNDNYHSCVAGCR